MNVIRFPGSPQSGGAQLEAGTLRQSNVVAVRPETASEEDQRTAAVLRQALYTLLKEAADQTADPKLADKARAWKKWLAEHICDEAS